MALHNDSEAVYSMDHILSKGGGDMMIAMARDKIAGYSFVHKYGKNFDLGTTPEAVWGGGGLYTGHNPTAAEIVTLVSDNASDAAAGAGARTVEIYGLDGDYLEISEVVTLNGVSAVDTTLEYLRLNRMIVRSAGSAGANAGIITAAQKLTPANIFAKMPVGYNQTMIAAYTLPANKRGYFLDWYASMAKKTAGYANVRILIRPPGEVFQVKEEVTVASTGTGYLQRGYTIPKGRIAPMSDIVVEADADAASFGVSAGFDLILVETTG